MPHYLAGDTLLIERDYDRDDFIDGAQSFAGETGYPAKIVSYDGFEEFLGVDENSVPLVPAGQIIQILEQRRTEELSLNLRFLPEGPAPEGYEKNVVMSYQDGEVHLDAGITTGLSVSELGEEHFGLEPEE